MATSISLILSYVVDWVIIILFAVVGALFNLIEPNHRAFDLADEDLSFPFTNPETVSTAVLVVVSLVAPAVLVLLVCLVLVPGPTAGGRFAGLRRGTVWRRKLWEWNAGWMGLALSLATAFFITQGMKLLFGKPRPDLLARCQPDLSNVAGYIVGGLGNKVLEGGSLVSYRICQQADKSILSDGFMSFPSGHASFSWSGMTYLLLFVCSKFAITIPYLLPGSYEPGAFRADPAAPSGSSSSTTGPSHSQLPAPLPKLLRSQAAAPPVYLLVLAFVPPCVAVFISASRYTDYRHHGFDIIVGGLIGFWAAYASFRWYHAPIRRGAGWSWGPRSKDRAWGVGVGVLGYRDLGEQGRSKRMDERASREIDPEMGHAGGSRMQASTMTQAGPVAHRAEGEAF